MNFRDKTPIRRTNPSSQSNYTRYRDELRSDFNCRCGYCHTHDFFRSTYYEIDHFVPKTIIKTIAKSDYSNLVYSCRSCNNSKRNKWPSNNEAIHNDGKIGFIDPCNEEYSKQFLRNEDGSIIPITELGCWMFKNLNLGNPSHRITWKLDELKSIIEELYSLRDSYKDNVSLLNSICDLCSEYFRLENELKQL